VNVRHNGVPSHGYITFHLPKCHHINESFETIALEVAEREDMRPCGVCAPEKQKAWASKFKDAAEKFKKKTTKKKINKH